MKKTLIAPLFLITIQATPKQPAQILEDLADSLAKLNSFTAKGVSQSPLKTDISDTNEKFAGEEFQGFNFPALEGKNILKAIRTMQEYISSKGNAPKEQDVRIILKTVTPYTKAQKPLTTLFDAIAAKIPEFKEMPKFKEVSKPSQLFVNFQIAIIKILDNDTKVHEKQIAIQERLDAINSEKTSLSQTEQKIVNDLESSIIKPESFRLLLHRHTTGNLCKDPMWQNACKVAEEWD